MRHFVLTVALLAVSVSAQQAPPSSGSALSQQGTQALRSGDFEKAISSFQSAVVADPKLDTAYAGLTTAYLKEQKVDDAFSAVSKGLQSAPDSPLLHTALADVLFRQGKIQQADEELVKVVNGSAPPARAYMQLASIYTVASMHALAKGAIDRAHDLDPSDPDILRDWLFTLPRTERVALLEKYLAGPTSEDAEDRDSLKQTLGLWKARKGRRCQLASPPATAEIDLRRMMNDPTHMRGYGLNVKVNGREAHLLLDTGAGGILISHRIAEKAGLAPVAQMTVSGIGDKGAMNSFAGYADSVRIGPLEFHDCAVVVSEKGSVADGDGLIGADVFGRYLVDLDLANEKMRLGPLPKRPAETQSASAPSTAVPTATGSAQDAAAEEDEEDAEHPVFKDRYIAPEMQQYNKILSFGHLLLIPTFVNSKGPMLFMIDTGSSHNLISEATARTVTGVSRENNVRMMGISGEVNKVYMADRATLQFSHFQQENQDMLSFDFSKLNKDIGTETSGALGFSILRMMDLKIDYRDGLVDFTFDSTRFH